MTTDPKFKTIIGRVTFADLLDTIDAANIAYDEISIAIKDIEGRWVRPECIEMRNYENEGHVLVFFNKEKES